jgi:hypothetical protein
MVVARPWWLLPKLNPRTSKKLLGLKLKPAPHQKMPKLMWRLKMLRREGVELDVFERMFCKDILAHLRHCTFREMEQVFL